jgi:hypothetical protein
LNGKQKTQWLEAIYKEMNKRDFEEGNCTNWQLWSETVKTSYLTLWSRSSSE